MSLLLRNLLSDTVRHAFLIFSRCQLSVCRVRLSQVRQPYFIFLVVYLVNVFGKWLTRVMLLASILLFLFLTVAVLLCYPLTFSGSVIPANLFSLLFIVA